jgi:uncharacterized membrane protein
MTNRTKISAAVIVVAAIFVLFILPSFDVAPTAFRAARAFDLLMLALAGAAFVLFALQGNLRLCSAAMRFRVNSSPDPLRMTCSLLC